MDLDPNLIRCPAHRISFNGKLQLVRIFILPKDHLLSLVIYRESVHRLSKNIISGFSGQGLQELQECYLKIEEMATSQSTKISLLLISFGLISFILGVIAENKKPSYGTPIKGKDVVICKFPTDVSIACGALSVVTLFIAAIVGHVAVYFPYKGTSIPRNALFQSTTLLTFFIVAEAVSVSGVGMMMWATITEGLHRSRNVHHDLSTKCPTAKTGLFGGAAFLALDASLFWLVCQMLTLNARADYFDEDEDPKGDYGKVYTDDLNNTEAVRPAI
ncbi:hypothetical protein Cni_G25051 [Canna indica]|uniref:Uncharacterized protein n=1 Tax=Canna indica TaxID=4628 RepID=A0AAQ3KX01_9LILI|nr:hypothetical protein Cni_G25051 [Canna indica]